MNSASSDIFDAYDDDFNGLARDISSKLSHASTYEESHEKKLQELRRASQILTQAQDLIKQMDVEVRSETDPGTKKSMNEKVGEYRKTLAALRRDHDELVRSEEHAQLVDDPALEQRNRLMEANHRLERGSDRIRHAMEVAADAESTALEITDELNRNREMIEGIHARVHAVSGLTDQARRVIHGMSKREVQQKIILWFVGLILVGVVGGIIYLVAS